MSFVSNILTPIIQLIVYIGLTLWVFYLIYYFSKKAFPNMRWFWKYKVFKKDYREEDVEFCMDAIEKNASPIDIKKWLLIKGQSVKRVNEIIYIYYQILRQLKGGKKNGRQSEEIIGKKVERFERKE